MNKTNFTSKMLILAVLFNITMILQSLAQLPPNDAAYELVFVDTFPGTQVNTTNWSSSVSWNQFDQYPRDVCQAIKTQGKGYQKRNFENCIVNNGILSIVSKKENYMGEIWDWPHCPSDSCETGPFDCNWDPNEQDTVCWYRDTVPFKYTTNFLISNKKFKYGYFEMKCKLSKPIPPKTNQGIGPNFWLWAADSNVGWSEIDIFEFDGLNNTCGANEHLEDSYGDTIHSIPNSPPNMYFDFSTDHTFGALWTPDKIEFYYDNVLFNTATFHCNRLIAMPIIIDVNFPLHTMCQTIDTVYTQLPHYFQIDYVKVWQLKTACDTEKVYCSFDPATYNSKLYKSVTIGGVGCNASISNQNNLSIYSNDYLLLNEGFSVDTQSNVYFNAQNNCAGQSRGNRETPSPGPPAPSFIERKNPKYHHQY